MFPSSIDTPCFQKPFSWRSRGWLGRRLHHRPDDWVAITTLSCHLVSGVTTLPLCKVSRAVSIFSLGTDRKFKSGKSATYLAVYPPFHLAVLHSRGVALDHQLVALPTPALRDVVGITLKSG